MRASVGTIPSDQLRLGKVLPAIDYGRLGKIERVALNPSLDGAGADVIASANLASGDSAVDDVGHD